MVVRDGVCVCMYEERVCVPRARVSMCMVVCVGGTGVCEGNGGGSGYDGTGGGGSGGVVCVMVVCACMCVVFVCERCMCV